MPASDPPVPSPGYQEQLSALPFKRLESRLPRPFIKRIRQDLRLRCRERTLMAMNQSSSEPRPGLLRALGPLMATAIVVGTVIGSGVFKKPQVVAASVPNFGIAALVWVAVGLLALLGALSLAEVAVLFPRAG